MDGPGIVLQRLRTNGAFSDLTVQCGAHIFRLHRNIVCTQSSWFEAACREGQWKEGDEKLIRLKAIGDQSDIHNADGDDPKAIELMIDFFYLQDYTIHDPGLVGCQSRNPSPSESDKIVEQFDSQEKDQATESVTAVQEKVPLGRRPLTTHSQMFVLGWKYDIPPLRTLSLRKLESEVNLDWEAHDQRANDLATALPIAFDQTPESDPSLRQLLTNLILKHLGKLLTNRVVMDAIQQVDGLVMDLLEKKTMLHQNRIVCTTCGKSEARRCAGSSKKNIHSFVSCGCDSNEYCSDCSQASYSVRWSL